MKVAILGDTHWGVRNDLPVFYDHFEKFYDWMFGELASAGVQTIFQLGDLFDRRKYINFRTYSESKRIFFDKLEVHGIQLITLLGNHDIFYRESVEVSSPALLLGGNNIRVVSSPETVSIGDTTIDIIPWICRENQEQCVSFINNSKSDLCLGHFEIERFPMYKGVDSHDGLPVSMFQKYELVCSGHYHTKSHRGNILYVGTPYEMTWQCYNDPKGFHIFDLETRKMEFRENPHTVFCRIEYVGQEEHPDVKGKFVRVVVLNKEDLFKFDKFVQSIIDSGAYEVKVIERQESLKKELKEEMNIENTFEILDHFVEHENSETKEKLKLFLKDLYFEASNREF